MCTINFDLLVVVLVTPAMLRQERLPAQKRQQYWSNISNLIAIHGGVVTTV